MDVSQLIGEWTERWIMVMFKQNASTSGGPHLFFFLKVTHINYAVFSANDREL